MTRTYRLAGLELGLEEPEAALRERACGRLGLEVTQLRGFRMAKKSLDARRRRGGMRYVCSVDLVLGTGPRSAGFKRALRSGKLIEAPQVGSFEVEVPKERQGRHVVVVGTGPAGIFAALVLARNGTRVTVIDRGAHDG